MSTTTRGRAAATFVAVLACAGAAQAGDCFEEAARFHGVSPTVLRAIAQVESGFQPDARSLNSNGSIDIGLMQLNSIHLPELQRWGIDARHLADPCVNVYVGAWHYRRQVDRHGNTWQAVGTYHSATPVHRDAYIARVQRVMAQWARQGRVTAPAVRPQAAAGVPTATAAPQP